jgi:hypothetical protein
MLKNLGEDREEILLGNDLSMFHIGAIDESDYYIKFYLYNKNDSFKWTLAVVYSPAQDDQKSQFLTELVNMCSWEALPILIDGNFNIRRNLDKKNKDSYNSKWPFLFNVVIDGLNLRELEMLGRKYTWANALENLTYDKLDRVLIATEWEQMFPLSTVINRAPSVPYFI